MLFRSVSQSRYGDTCQLDKWVQEAKTNPNIIGIIWYLYAANGPDAGIDSSGDEVEKKFLLDRSTEALADSGLASRINRGPYGTIENISNGQINGWAIDPDQGTGSVSVRASFDNGSAVDATANLPSSEAYEISQYSGNRNTCTHASHTHTHTYIHILKTCSLSCSWTSTQPKHIHTCITYTHTPIHTYTFYSLLSLVLLLTY